MLTSQESKNEKLRSLCVDITNFPESGAPWSVGLIRQV